MLAARQDVADRLGRELTSVEEAEVDGLIADASLTVATFLRWTSHPDPVPEQVRQVVARMVVRFWRSAAGDVPVGLSNQQDSAGPFSQQRSFADGVTSGDPWLTRADKQALRLVGPRSARAVKTW